MKQAEVRTIKVKVNQEKEVLLEARVSVEVTAEKAINMKETVKVDAKQLLIQCQMRRIENIWGRTKNPHQLQNL